jgi:hypothetical protein
MALRCCVCPRQMPKAVFSVAVIRLIVAPAIIPNYDELFSHLYAVARSRYYFVAFCGRGNSTRTRTWDLAISLHAIQSAPCHITLCGGASTEDTPWTCRSARARPRARAHDMVVVVVGEWGVGTITRRHGRSRLCSHDLQRTVMASFLTRGFHHRSP